MNALAFLVRKSAKNSLLELRKKPGKLALYAIIALMFIGVIAITIFVSPNSEGETAPLHFLIGALFLFIGLFFVISVLKGMAGGDAIFEMNDANLLFVSPVNPRMTLLYGVFRMAKTSFMAGFFIFFQANTFASFGVGYGGVILTFAVYLLSAIVLTMSSLIIYSATSGRPRRKLAAKCICALCFAPLAAYAAAQYLATGDALSMIERAVASPFFSFTPVAGWASAGVSHLLAGGVVPGLSFIGLLLLGLACMVAYIMVSNPDYYEDVLVATESSFEKKRALAEGDINTAMGGSKNAIRIAKTGLSGHGASALFGKHMRENMRQNRFGLLTTPSALVVLGAIALTMFTRRLIVALQVLAWLQIFLIGTGRGLKETYSHYIYMIPETSFKKIVWSNMEIMARTMLENALIFGAAGALLRSSPAEALACFTAYTMFSFLLLAVNYISFRFAGADISSGLLIMIYFLCVAVAVAPGIALGIVVGAAVGGAAGLTLGLLALSAWELAAGLGLFFLSHGVLHECDMAMMKPNR